MNSLQFADCLDKGRVGALPAQTSCSRIDRQTGPDPALFPLMPNWLFTGRVGVSMPIGNPAPQWLKRQHTRGMERWNNWSSVALSVPGCRPAAGELLFVFWNPLSWLSHGTILLSDGCGVLRVIKSLRAGPLLALSQMLCVSNGLH